MMALSDLGSRVGIETVGAEELSTLFTSVLDVTGSIVTFLA